MPERIVLEDPTIPQPGRRSGTGSSSLLPYLAKTLAAKPKTPSQVEGDTPREKSSSEPETPASG